MDKANKYDQIIQDLYINSDVEDLLNNQFTFSRKYDMERCLKPVQMNPINWHLIPFGDPEWTWVFHRMEYCIDLCLQTEKTGDLKYIMHAKSLVFDFIDNSLYTENEHRTLDTGIRIISWVKFYKRARALELLNADETSKLTTAIIYQVENLYENYRVSDEISNWGAIQCVGVLNAVKYFEIDESISKFFGDQFEKHLDMQYYGDGMQWEQSSVYIIEVTIKMLEMENEQFHTEKYYETLTRVFFALYGMCDNDFNSILLGDGDKINVEALLQAISYVTKTPELLAYLKSSQVYEEVYNLYGDKVIDYLKEYANLLNSKNDFTKLFPNCGLLAIKSENHYLTFQNGPMGGGHGHVDNLHINLYIDNTPILIDSGRYSYVESKEYREYLKSANAHNGFIFDHELVDYKNTWRSMCNFFYSPITYQTYRDYTYAEASITSQENFGYRQIIHFKNGSTLIFNSSFSEFAINYILNDELTPKTNADYISLGENRLYSFTKETNLETCEISKDYNQKQPSSVVNNQSINNQVISYFCPNDSSITEVFDFSYIYQVQHDGIENTMRAFEVKCGTDCFTIFHLAYENAINNSAIKYLDHTIFGKLVILDNQTGELTVLKN